MVAEFCRKDVKWSLQDSDCILQLVLGYCTKSVVSEKNRGGSVIMRGIQSVWLNSL